MDSDGNVEYLGKLKEKYLTVKCADSTGKVVAEKTYTILKERYSITPPEVDGYEPAVEKIEGEMEENTTISQLYYMIFDDDTTLVFSGLDASGNVTTDEASIVSYMVGDGTNTIGNGLLEKTVQGVLKVPEIYNRKPIIQIGEKTFRNCENIKKVIIGDNIEKIQTQAFGNCYGIEEILIGQNVNTIGGNAFSYCKQLKTVIITSENEEQTFNCFEGCTNFTEIKVNSDNKVYKVEDNILCSKDGKTMYLVPKGRTGEFVVPDGVESIYETAARQCGKIMQKLVIADTVKTIQWAAFAYCYGIEEVVIGENVEDIGNNAFGYCKNLKTITIRTENELIFGCFEGCASFTEIKVDSDNKTYKVEDNVLYSIDGKTMYLVPKGRTGELVIPSGVEIIYGQAARVCGQIQGVVIPSSVKTIQGNAFANCGNLKEVVIDSESIVQNITSYNACGSLVSKAETIYINDDITTIGSYISNTENFTVETSDKEGYIKYVKTVN